MNIYSIFPAKTTTGPLVSAEHKVKRTKLFFSNAYSSPLSIQAKVLSYILLAQSSEGSRVHFAGGAATAEPANLPSELQTGYYVNPTVVTGLVPTDRCQLEEIFGPVVTISPFETEEQVLTHKKTTRTKRKKNSAQFFDHCFTID